MNKTKWTDTTEFDSLDVREHMDVKDQMSECMSPQKINRKDQMRKTTYVSLNKYMRLIAPICATR